MMLYRRFSGPKTYCFGCEKTNACSCGTTDKQFTFTHKLRPPKNTKNKERFRTFLDNCPEFFNMVLPEQRKYAIALLKKVKYYEKRTNGREWTFITRGE